MTPHPEETMYALAFVRYRRPLEEVLVHVDAHRAYLRDLQASGWLLASGPLDPRNGGALLLRVPDDAVQATLDRIREGDPFILAGVAQYEVWPWLPNIGKENLDRL
jgi:uncharacterized protein YciI